MIFKPHKDLAYAVIIWSGPILLAGLAAVSGFSWLFMFVIIASAFLSLWLWNSTEYRIDGQQLFLKCWLFRKRVSIENIKSIKRTRNYFSSFALAVDRLEIKVGPYDTFYISPLERTLFINECKAVNAGIRVDV